MLAFSKSASADGEMEVPAWQSAIDEGEVRMETADEG